MSYPKDKLAFTFVHSDNGELCFISNIGGSGCSSSGLNKGLLFDSLVEPTALQQCQEMKELTRCTAPALNKCALPLLGLPQAVVYERYVEQELYSGYEGVVFASACEGMDYLAGIILDNSSFNRKTLIAAAAAAAAADDKLVAVQQLHEDTVVYEIVRVFEENYIHFPQHDEWFTSGGKQRFAAQVSFFVQRKLQLQLVLPAFPVKSCNLDKVISKCPDKGEELAIRTMKIVADLITKVYAPGVHFNVVSDGHVFSDLVGADDATVDNYGEMFRKMAADMYPGLITFYRLDDLLMQEDALEEIRELVSGLRLPHPVSTALTEEAEEARRIMMYLFGSDESSVKEDIREDPETAKLYRGFSKFMLEDLGQHESCKCLLSKSAKKRLCERVGFLMIQRNRAYSTLVAWLFPLHLRVSIHPHPNRGPKYGINVIHHSLVASQRSSSERIFHIPTPWHNSVLELEDGKFMLMPSATILGKKGSLSEELKVDYQLLDGYKVELIRYDDGRPSHYKQVKASL